MTESTSSRLCERVGRCDVRASRSTRKVSRSVRKAQGAGVATAGGGLWEGQGVAFPRAGGARDCPSHTVFGKSGIIGLPIYFLLKIPYKASRHTSRQASESCSDKLSDKHSINRRPKALKLPFLIPLP